MNEETFPEPIQVSVNTANEWEKRYQDDREIEDSKKKVKAFLVPKESLKKVLELDTEAVWAYLGINEQKEKTLLFCGANYDKEAKKWINVYGKKDGVSGDEAAEDVLYDGARPSPPY